jgi:hypothetical protein
MVFDFKRINYHTFWIKDEKTNQNEEFVVQRLPVELHRQAFDFMTQNHLEDETEKAFQKPALVSQEELKEFYRLVLYQNASIVCLKKGTKEIIALNALVIKTRCADTTHLATTIDTTFRV